MKKTRSVRTVIVFSAAALCAGCSGLYYKTWETLGYHKRDILVENVEEARDSQEEAKEQFQSALEKFTALVKVEAGELKATYDKLNAEYEKSKSRAASVSSHVADVEEVANDLFTEWQEELEEYGDAGLRRQSEEQLKATKSKYEELIGSMKRAEDKMGPVLKAFGDRVLFLKHNLNAQAIASLKNELTTVETNVAALIKDMETAVAEANQFIGAMKPAEA
jgi:NADH dehydrogenase/NADH:ubiquinone oxidoreductase subunit G